MNFRFWKGKTTKMLLVNGIPVMHTDPPPKKPFEKSNAWFVKFFEKFAKIIHFRNFLKKFLKIFENFPKTSYAKIMNFSQFS